MSEVNLISDYPARVLMRGTGRITKPYGSGSMRKASAPAMGENTAFHPFRGGVIRASLHVNRMHFSRKAKREGPHGGGSDADPCIPLRHALQCRCHIRHRYLRSREIIVDVRCGHGVLSVECTIRWMLRGDEPVTSVLPNRFECLAFIIDCDLKN
jgi:hypothetical protein